MDMHVLPLESKYAHLYLVTGTNPVISFKYAALKVNCMRRNQTHGADILTSSNDVVCAMQARKIKG